MPMSEPCADKIGTPWSEEQLRIFQEWWTAEMRRPLSPELRALVELQVFLENPLDLYPRSYVPKGFWIGVALIYCVVTLGGALAIAALGIQ